MKNKLHHRLSLSNTEQMGFDRNYSYSLGNDELEKKKSGRSDRALSRNTKRNNHFFGYDVNAFGNSIHGVCPTFLGYENFLRFSKNVIHGWGIISDKFIPKGDFIVEYRGVIIDNKEADRRENEYRRSKINCDYMFRIDDDMVCDGTKCGNIARFINGSCNPNSKTKIISIDGTKRIGIYAVKNILPGHEICYDYKFDLENDTSKRIPCNCGSKKCGGYMNWDVKKDKKNQE